VELEAILTSDGSAQWWYSPDAPRAAIQAVRSRWDDTGGDLKHYESLFKVARNTQQAATLLRIREEDVPAILHFLGLELARDEYWRPSNKPERRELAELAAVADAAGHWSLRVDSLAKDSRRSSPSRPASVASKPRASFGGRRSRRLSNRRPRTSRMSPSQRADGTTSLR